MISPRENLRRLRTLRDVCTFLTAWTVVSLLLKRSDLYYTSTIPSANKIQDRIESKSDGGAEPKSLSEASNEKKLNTFQNTTSHEGTSRKLCAPWIPESERKVLFVELHSWDVYYGPSKYKTGEYYVSATWDYALRRNGFQVHRVSTRQFFERMTAEQMLSYHRIFFRDPKWNKHFNRHDILCRVRPMYYFGEWYQGKIPYNDWFKWPFDRKQILVAHPETYNTFLGYFPHNLVSDESLPEAKRGRVGLLLGKKPNYFVPYQEVIQRLISDGFELHSTCTDTETMKCPFPEQVIRHQNLGPSEYAKLMTKFSFMLGFQKPPGSPSPIVGLSYGVSFLNPIRDGAENQYTQHKALSRLGMPYVYNVNLTDHDEVVRAAEWSTRYRFSSYVPAEFRVESLVDRMCALLEDDALCLCPNPLFGDDQLDFRRSDELDKKMDCRASTYVRKEPVFPTGGGYSNRR